MLLAEAAKGSSEGSQWLAQAELLRKMRRYEDLPLPPNEPLSAVKRYLAALFVTRENRQRGERLSDWLRALRHGAEASGTTGEIAADVALGSIQFTVEGDDSVGFRVRSQGASDSGLSEM